MRWFSLNSRLLVSIVSADFWESVRILNRHNIPVYAINIADSLSGQITIPYDAFAAADELLKKRGDRLVPVNESGLHAVLRKLCTRPVLVFGIMLLLVLFLYLPTRVLHIDVIGNQKIPTNHILSAAESAGIHIWSSRRAIRSEKAKNLLLSTVPELKWAGVNTYGCNAVISVQERAAKPDTNQNSGTVSNVVAVRDGIILSASVQNGTLLCQPGQAVTAGQQLISGYTDCGICLRASRAEGEIYAKTSQTLRVVALDSVTRKQTVSAKKKYSLILGKKRINLWKGSGISDSGCGRIYTQYQLTLPGGYRLPVCLATETEILSQNEEEKQPAAQLHSLMSTYAGTYLMSQMIAGTIQDSDASFSVSDGRYQLLGRYQCMEMIGREHFEIGEPNE